MMHKKPESFFRDSSLPDARGIWVEQLYEAFDNVCFQHKVKLPRPVIEVNDSQLHWGEWHAHTRSLKIARALIENHSWDVVVSVLKHEMAHLMVSEVFGKVEAHGPWFETACDLLCVPEEFAHATTDLQSNAIRHWKDSGANGAGVANHEDQLLRKVERLLALAESSNEHEAFLAMEKVQQLFAKHNIERIKEKRDAQYVYLIINHHKKRIDRAQQLICSIVGEHYFVSVIYAELFDAHALEKHKVVEFLGTKQNVLMAEYVYFFLLARIEVLWLQYRKTHGAAAGVKNSYQSGLLVGFRDKLDSARRNFEAGDLAASKRHSAADTDAASHSHITSEKSEHALLKLKDKQLEVFKARRYPRLNMVRSGRTSFDRDTYDAGHSEGQRLVLSKGVTDVRSGGGGLLGKASR